MASENENRKEMANWRPKYCEYNVQARNSERAVETRLYRGWGGKTRDLSSTSTIALLYLSLRVLNEETGVTESIKEGRKRTNQ